MRLAACESVRMATQFALHHIYALHFSSGKSVFERLVDRMAGSQRQTIISRARCKCAMALSSNGEGAAPAPTSLVPTSRFFFLAVAPFRLLGFVRPIGTCRLLRPHFGCKHAPFCKPDQDGGGLRMDA